MAFRISVVDANESFLTIMQTLLDEQGYDVDIVEGSPTAYEQVSAFKPDLIILDLRLGASNGGLQLLDVLRLDPLLTTTPVIVCSADIGGLYARTDAFVHQGVRVLEKPFGLEELLSLLEDMLPTDATRPVNA